MICEDIDFDDFSKPSRAADPLRFLPEDLRESAKRLPPDQAYTVLELEEPGKGHNASLLKVASICYKMGVPFEDVLEHLQTQYDPERIDYRTAPRRAVQRVWDCEGQLDKIINEKETDTPSIEEEALMKFRRTQKEELLEHSPHPDPKKVRPVEVIKTLFEPDHIINLQFTAFEAGTLARVGELDELFTDSNTKANDWKFLNPSHFKKVEGVVNPLDKEGRVATRCNANVKKRDWMVLEMDDEDQGKVERFTGFALQMAKFAPLHMAMDTGGKSLHFWFDLRNSERRVTKEFFKLACLHGADPRMAVKSQIARMPNVTPEKEGRTRQTMLYFDPEGKKKPRDPDTKKVHWDLEGFETYLALNKQIEFFYHGKSKTFFTKENQGAWVALDRTSVKTHLAEIGFRIDRMEGERIAPVDAVVNSLQLDKSIDSVLPALCGRRAGYYEENGFRYVVQKSPDCIKPAKGQWNTIGALLKSQFDWFYPQLEIFLGWLSSGVRDFHNEGRRTARFSQAQFMHIAGEKDAGKSLLLVHILPAMFGGRSSSCIDLFKRTSSEFNAHLFQSELLFLDDTKELETNYQFRAAFGEKIKELTVGAGGGADFRGMFQDKVPVRPWWRFIRMMNTEPATLATIPPLEDGVEDKLILLRARSMEHGPFAAIKQVNPNWFEQVERNIRKELPHFLHYLLYEHKIADEVKDPWNRYPVKSFKNPDLVIDFEQTEPHTQILFKMDNEAKHRLFAKTGFDEEEENFKEIAVPWLGTANQLYDILAQCGSRSSQVRFQKICPSTQTLVSQLRRLENQNQKRATYSLRQDKLPKKRQGFEYWIINPPGYIDPEEEEIDDSSWA